MKQINNNEFNINKTTMRDLTPYEMSSVIGGSDEQAKSVVTITATIIITKTIEIIITKTTITETL